LTYGNQYVARLENGHITRLFDMDVLGRARAGPGWFRAVIEGDRVVVNDRDSISAWSIHTGQPLWRSASGVSSTNHASDGAIIYTAHWRADDRGEAFAVDASNGDVVARATILGHPDAIELAGDTIVIKSNTAISYLHLR
jgi:outer membrane protein assembly factor BamB